MPGLRALLLQRCVRPRLPSLLLSRRSRRLCRSCRRAASSSSSSLHRRRDGSKQLPPAAGGRYRAVCCRRDGTLDAEQCTVEKQVVAAMVGLGRLSCASAALVYRQQWQPQVCWQQVYHTMCWLIAVCFEIRKTAIHISVMPHCLASGQTPWLLVVRGDDIQTVIAGALCYGRVGLDSGVLAATSGRNSHSVFVKNVIGTVKAYASRESRRHPPLR
jgi:hypothetical protein